MKNQKNVTELEKKVISILNSCDMYDDMPCGVIEDFYGEEGLTKQTVRGVLSSLYQKDIILTGELPNGTDCYFLWDVDFYEAHNIY